MFKGVWYLGVIFKRLTIQKKENFQLARSTDCREHLELVYIVEFCFMRLRAYSASLYLEIEDKRKLANEAGVFTS